MVGVEKRDSVHASAPRWWARGGEVSDLGRDCTLDCPYSRLALARLLRSRRPRG